jgi:MtfA peptidase
VLGHAFEELQQDVAQRRRQVLDGYGATNPAEFFAVATETFFEEGARLKRDHPELYGVLREYYRQDPAGREENAKSLPL